MEENNLFHKTIFIFQPRGILSLLSFFIPCHPWTPGLVVQLVHVNRIRKRYDRLFHLVSGERLPHVVGVFVVLSTVVLQDGAVNDVAKLLVEVDSHLVAHLTSETDNITDNKKDLI